jgi:hypothetical protein
MKVFLALHLAMFAGLLAAADTGPNTLSSQEKARGWRLLFDGTSFQGWRGYRLGGMPETGWMIDGGLLKTVPGVKGGDLITQQKFDDFEFSWEWRIAPAGNNGIKYLVTEERPTAPGHEYQMVDDETNPDAKLGPKRATAAFYDVLAPAAGRAIKPAGEWNQSRVVVKGNRVEHWLNGTKALEYQLGSERVKEGLANSKFKGFADFGTKIQGHLMLTYHHDECWFRNLKIRELTPE